MCFFFYIVKAPHPGAFSHSLPNTSYNDVNRNALSMFKVLNKCLCFILYHAEGRLKLLKISSLTFFLTVNNSTFVFEGIQSCAKNVACVLSHISIRPRVAYLVLVSLVTWVAMWDRFFRQRANTGTTRSCMRW